MAEGVVHVLEVIDIDVVQRQTGFLAGSFRQQRQGYGGELLTVDQPCQRIVVGQELNPGVGQLLLAATAVLSDGGDAKG